MTTTAKEDDWLRVEIKLKNDHQRVKYTLCKQVPFAVSLKFAIRQKGFDCHYYDQRSEI